MDLISKFLTVPVLCLMFACGNTGEHGHAHGDGHDHDHAAFVANAETEFYVRGNCGMCKKRINATMMSIEGVASSEYDVKSKMLKVAFDSTLTDALALHKAVAAVGHETKEVPMDEQAHEDLPECCKKDAGTH